MSISIDKLRTQPIDASENVTLIPPGAVKVADKTGADLFAIRFNSADLTGKLNGAISSQGLGEYTSGILFENDAGTLLDGSLIFSSGKMALSVSGSGEVTGIYGSEVEVVGAGGLPLSGSLNVLSKSGASTQATGIYADAKFRAELALAMNVKADASKGVDADAVGLGGEITMLAASDKFKLNVEAKAGSGNADANGIDGSLSVSNQLGGTVGVKADASKGVGASAQGIHARTQAATVSDKFKLNVQAKAGSGGAVAYGFSGSALTVDGTLGGTVSVSADSSGDSSVKADSVGFYAVTQVADVSDKFKLTSQAKSISAMAGAAAFVKEFTATGTLGGTIAVKSDSKSGTVIAAGFDDNVRAAGVSDKFKLTVNAKSGSGMAKALGFTATDIASGLSGKISVAAVSKTNTATAIGGTLYSRSTFRTAAANELAVTAQTGSGSAEALACGITGKTGGIDLAGVLAVSANGKHGIAYGVRATSGAVTGSISGAIAAVGNDATGISGGALSELTISGAVYAGNKGNAAGIAKSLDKLAGSGKSASGNSKNADQAVSLGICSTLTLTNGSIVIGDVTMETSSTLNLSTGSQLYGDIDLNADGALRFTINGTLNKAAVVTLDSAGAGVFAPTSGVNLTINATEFSKTGSYVLLAGSDLSELSNVDYNSLFNMVDFGTYGFNTAWELDLSGKTDKLTLVLSREPVGPASNLLSATDLNSADRMLASSSLTEDAANSGASFRKNSLIA